MAKPSPVALLEQFASVPDPRIERHRWHKLSDILLIAVCAVLSGAESYPASEDFGTERESWLRQCLELPAGIPSHDTFNRVLRLLDPVEWQSCFLRWRQAVADVTDGEVVAVDGKALRRSFAKGASKRAIHRVSAWATANGVVLGQRKVETKSNELTAIPALLALLALKGGIVTIDAIGCQRDSAQKIVEQGADYVLALKGNQPTLEQAVKRFFLTGPQAEAHWSQSDYPEHTERGHGRVETRRAWIRADLDAELRTAAWPGLQSIGLVEATRTVGEKTAVEQRFYLSSLPPRSGSLPRPCANTGGLRTSSTGRWMSPFGKIRVGCGRATGRRTLPSCAISHSTSYGRSPALRASPANASPALSIPTTCLKCCWESSFNALALHAHGLECAWGD
jgi:predicted transposase YbfD/YdcC